MKGVETKRRKRKGAVENPKCWQKGEEEEEQKRGKGERGEKRDVSVKT